MEKLKEILQSLKTWHKMVIGAVLLAVVTIVSLYFTLPDNHVAVYKNLNEQDQQDILAEMSKLGVDYQIGKDGAITVPKKDAVWVRNKMTEMGLPSNGGGGEDILLESSLGASEQDKKMRQIVGIRKQLERDIVKNIDAVETANVQITLPDKESIFDEKIPEGTAAVTIGTRRNQALTTEQILGIQYMVSAAVPGVKAEDVSVIDSKKGVISEAEGGANPSGSASYEKELAMQQQIEEKLKKDIAETLVNLFQINNFHVNTSVSVNYDEVTRQIEKYGDKGILRSKQEQSEQSTAREGDGGNPEAGIAANGEVPTYENEAIGNGQVTYEQNNKNVTENYEIDKTVETIKKHPELTKTNVVVWVDEKTLLKRNIDINVFREAIGTAAGLQADQNGFFTNGQVNVVPVQFEQKKEAAIDETDDEGGINWALVAGIAAPLLLGAIGGTAFFMRKRKRKEEESLFMVDDDGQWETAASAEPGEEKEENSKQDVPLDKQIQEIAKSNIDETARVLKKWLNEQ
ncbi:MAG: flagellar basal-body MS-ring/collar protein FliF [Ectobacillus sp.]